MGERVDDPGQLPINTGQEKTSEQRIEDIKRDLFDREMPPEYQSLIEGAKFIRLNTEYSEHLFESFCRGDDLSNLTDLGHFITDEIKDHIVLDLGCGQSCKVNWFAEVAESSSYVGVDLNPAIFPHKSAPGSAPPMRLPEDEEFVPYDPSKDNEESAIHKYPEFRLEENALQVSGDMLRAVSRMKSHSIKLIIMSGIETEPGGSTTIDYISALKKEIKRVLTEDGLFLNYHSDISLPDLEKVDISGSLEGLDIRRNRETEVLEASEN